MRHHFGVNASLISQGEKPAEVAVTESIDFEAAINLQTARALGVKVSPGVLYIADDVIEWLDL